MLKKVGLILVLMCQCSMIGMESSGIESVQGNVEKDSQEKQSSVPLSDDEREYNAYKKELPIPLQCILEDFETWPKQDRIQIATGPVINILHCLSHRYAPDGTRLQNWIDKLTQGGATFLTKEGAIFIALVDHLKRKL